MSLPCGFVVRKDKDLFIVFRGTRTPLEWFRNSEIKQTTFDSLGRGNTTQGFSRIFTALWSSIEQILSQENINTLDNNGNPTLNIFITGHSLGGALATLCAAKVKDEYKNPRPILYTFASPRVGDLEFASKFQDLQIQSFRIANTEDIVSTVPLATSVLAKEQPLFFTPDFVELTFEAAELTVNSSGSG